MPALKVSQWVSANTAGCMFISILFFNCLILNHQIYHFQKAKLRVRSGAKIRSIAKIKNGFEKESGLGE